MPARAGGKQQTGAHKGSSHEAGRAADTSTTELHTCAGVQFHLRPPPFSRRRGLQEPLISVPPQNAKTERKVEPLPRLSAPWTAPLSQSHTCAGVQFYWNDHRPLAVVLPRNSARKTVRIADGKRSAAGFFAGMPHRQALTVCRAANTSASPRRRPARPARNSRTARERCARPASPLWPASPGSQPRGSTPPSRIRRRRAAGWADTARCGQSSCASRTPRGSPPAPSRWQRGKQPANGLLP